MLRTAETREKSTLTATEAQTEQPVEVELPPVKALNWFEGLLCHKLGIHKGKWVYMAEEKCGQITVCPRCGKTRTRTRHQREWRYSSERSKNTRAMTCDLCGMTFPGSFLLEWHQRSTHKIEPLVKSGAETCEQQPVCKRCAEVWPRFRIRHAWGPTYSMSGSTSGHTCLRCGKVESWSNADSYD